MIEEAKLKFRELAAEKRAELESAIESRQVKDPISILIAVGISAALSTASYLVSRAFAPKPPRQQFGKLSGSLQLQNSEQGLFIPEIYGASPDSASIVIVPGSSPTYQNIANCATGANGALTKNAGSSFSWNAGASHNVAVQSGDDAFLEVIAGAGHTSAGFATTASPRHGWNDFKFAAQWNIDRTVAIQYNNGAAQVLSVTTWVVGDKFKIELRNGSFRLFKNAALISYNVPITPTYPLYLGIAILNTGAGVSNAKVHIGNIGDAPNASRGGIKVPAIIVWSSGIRKRVSVTQQPTGGGKGGGGGGGSQPVENITYDIDLGMEFCRGPVNLLRLYANADVLIDQTPTSDLATGVYDPTIGADPTYDPAFPPDSLIPYLNSNDRVNAEIAFDIDDVGTGVIQGGGSPFAIYPGNTTQQPDPTIEADVDGRYGTGSTPAYRNHSLVVSTNLQLSRWGGIVPNITAVWEHQTLKTWDLICASLCERVNVKVADNDYNFTGLSTLACRGLLISGRLFTPAEVIGSPEIQTVNNFFITEAEGQVIGLIEGNEPSITIADTEIGWMDSDAEVSDVLPEVDTVIASEITLPRQVDVKYIDPDNDWDVNTQSDNRQITEGVSTEVLEVQLALLATEARAAAQRKLYQGYVAGSAHKFTLPWTYLYLYPGYKITITRAEGFSHVMKLSSITGGIGILDCEGIALEPAAFTQPANSDLPVGYVPPQSIPAMTIVSLLDVPLLREGDETVNNGVGFYACGVPRTGVSQNWQGFALYGLFHQSYVVMESFNLPATVGTIVSATGLSSDTSVLDRTGKFTVDLYGTTSSLTSVTETELLSVANTNLAIAGNMVIQFATATQVADYPNRWELTTLLNGRRGTESRITESFTNKRFVLINNAVKFVPMEISDLGSTRSYRAVTVGQSLGDAATVEFGWTGETLKPLSPVNLRGTRNSLGDLFIEWTRRTRFGAGMIPGSDVPLGEEVEQYDVEILTTGDVLKRTMRVVPGGAQAAIILPTHAQYASTINGNSVTGIPEGSGPSGAGAYTQQQLNSNGAWVEATLQLTSSVQSAFIELFLPDEVSRNTSPSQYYELSFSNITGSGATVFRVNRKLPGGTEDNVFESEEYPGLTSARVRLVIIGSEVRFYWDYLGPGSVPVYVSPTSMQLPVVPRFVLISSSKLNNAYVGNNINGPSVIYAGAQQVADFGALQNPIRVRSAQVSSIVGRGLYIQADL